MIHGFLSLIVTLLVINAFFIIVSRIKESRREVQRHRELTRRVRQLRLCKMLSYLGVELDEYARALPPYDTESHVRNCKGCEALETCDACLRDGKIVWDMNFCPNYGSLIKHSKTIADHR